MKYDKNHALLECSIPGIPQKSGKVRDVFDLGDKLLMVVTDRISAFDVILPCGVPDKGKVLNQLSLFWLDFFGVKNHLITANVDEYPAELQPYKEDLRGRSMLVKKVKMVEVECIARGYLTGSGWKEYQKSQTVNGEKLRAGYENASKLDEVLFTPTTKAAIGDHDEAINYAETVKLVGEATAKALRDATIGLYSKAADYAAQHGIIIADTKFEFGKDADGSLILADEVLTPDSSRFWPQASYKVGANPPSLDKQYVRDWLDSINFNHQPPGPVLPDDVIARTREIYVKAYENLSGKKLVFNQPILEKILQRFRQSVINDTKRQEAFLDYDIDEYDERLLRHLALGYTKDMIANLRTMPFGVKSIEKRQNDLVARLFGSERTGVNATRLVTRAFELRILDIDNLEPDED